MIVAGSRVKLVGTIAHTSSFSDSKVYWKCPGKKCKDMHFFTFIIPCPGIIPIYEMQRCVNCGTKYSASQVEVKGKVAILIAKIKESSC